MRSGKQVERQGSNESGGTSPFPLGEGCTAFSSCEKILGSRLEQISLKIRESLEKKKFLRESLETVEILKTALVSTNFDRLTS